MEIRFTKMNAQGNDFVIVDSQSLKLSEKDLIQLTKDICDRHFGLGADGLVLLNHLEPEMVIYNSDGSRAEICGSALRCCCKLISAATGNLEIDIKTDAGILKGTVDAVNPDYVKVEMVTPLMISKSLSVESFQGDYVNVGNPHFVIFVESLSDKPHLKYGQALSEHKSFEQGANIEFICVISGNEIELVVWERGVGATLACGTGSTAAVFSGQEQGLLGNEVKVHLPGGEITISQEQNKFYLGGETTLVAKGVYIWKV